VLAGEAREKLQNGGYPRYVSHDRGAYRIQYSTNATSAMYIYRVSQKERSIFWEVIVSVILNKKLYMNMCPIPNGFRDRVI
jgi:hypothetical protein